MKCKTYKQLKSLIKDIENDDQLYCDNSLDDLLYLYNNLLHYAKKIDKLKAEIKRKDKQINIKNGLIKLQKNIINENGNVMLSDTFVCEECGETFFIEDMYDLGDPYFDKKYCESCASELQETEGWIFTPPY